MILQLLNQKLDGGMFSPYGLDSARGNIEIRIHDVIYAKHRPLGVAAKALRFILAKNSI